MGYIPSKSEPFSTPSEEPFSMSPYYWDISSTISPEPSSAYSSNSESSSSKSNESEWSSSYMPSPVSSPPSYMPSSMSSNNMNLH